MEPVDFGGMEADASGVLDPVKDIGEESIPGQRRSTGHEVRGKLFKDAFMGKSTFQSSQPAMSSHEA